MIQAFIGAILNFFRNLWNDYEARKILKELGAAEATIKTQEIINDIAVAQASVEPPTGVDDLVRRFRLRADQSDNGTQG